MTGVADDPVLPGGGFSRGVRLASLPLGLAGRSAVGMGKRIGGRSADAVAAEVQRQTAEQLYAVLGELKGGAMKVGQAMSVFEAALPEEAAGPYRATLTRLQEAAPPMPAARVHAVLAEEFSHRWRDMFSSFSDTPAAAASIGQVHRAVWSDGTPVAVKVQYPGAGKALVADLRTLGRFARLFAVVSPGLDVKPILAELEERVAEELDYVSEADSTAAFAAAYADDPDVRVPRVFAGADKVLVTEWVDGRPLSDLIRQGTPEERDHAGLLFAHFLFSSPARVGLLHADPHPGNYRLTADGRLCVLDFGAVDRLPGGLPEPLGRLCRLSLAGDTAALLAGLRAEGFVRRGQDVDARELHSYLRPLLDPVARETFTFTRPWLQAEAARLGDPRSEAAELGRRLNLPPEYVLIHRVTLGGMGVLTQLGASGPFRSVLERWAPGFAQDASLLHPAAAARAATGPAAA